MVDQQLIVVICDSRHEICLLLFAGDNNVFCLPGHTVDAPCCWRWVHIHFVAIIVVSEQIGEVSESLEFLVLVVHVLAVPPAQSNARAVDCGKQKTCGHVANCSNLVFCIHIAKSQDKQQHELVLFWSIVWNPTIELNHQVLR